MTQKQLSRLWLVVSAALLFYAINAWIGAQGGNPIFDLPLIKTKGAAAAVVAIPICSILLTVGSCVGILYARRAGKAWHERIPMVGFEEFDTSSNEGKIYQLTMMFIFMVVPISAFAYFWSRLVSAEVILNLSYPPNVDPISIWDWSKLIRLSNPALLCTSITHSAEGAPSCIDKITVLPGAEPLIFLFLTIGAILMCLRHIFLIFSSSDRGSLFGNFLGTQN